MLKPDKSQKGKSATTKAAAHAKQNGKGGAATVGAQEALQRGGQQLNSGSGQSSTGNGQGSSSSNGSHPATTASQGSSQPR